MNYTDFTPDFIKQFKARIPKELPFSLEVTKGSDITGSVEIRDQYSIIATVNGKPYYVKERAQFIVDACNVISDALEEIEYLQGQVNILRKEK